MAGARDGWGEAERCVCLSFRDIRKQNFLQKEKNFDNVYDQMLAQWPREVVQSPLLEIFTTWPDTALCKLIWQDLLWAGSCIRSPLEVPPRLHVQQFQGDKWDTLLVSYTHIYTHPKEPTAHHMSLYPHSFCPAPALLFPLQPCLFYFVSFSWTLFI